MVAAARTFETVRSMRHGSRGSKLNASGRPSGAGGEFAKSGAKMSTAPESSDKREVTMGTFMLLKKRKQLLCRNWPMAEAAIPARSRRQALAAGPDIHGLFRTVDNLGGDRLRQTKMSAAGDQAWSGVGSAEAPIK